MTRIYLAGKIAKNDWRQQLVSGLRSAYSELGTPGAEWPRKWTQLTMGRKDFHYVGPFFISCDHGCAHMGNAHGAGEGGCLDGGVHGGRRYNTAFLCDQAIRDCDVFFAWLGPSLDREEGYETSCTAYGTLVEIGMAHALGKKVVIGSDGHHDDLWFAYAHADHLITQMSRPLTAFLKWANTIAPPDEQRPKCQSPLELAFWDCHLSHKLPELAGLVAQYHVTANGNHYSLDFALPPRKIAFEMDGYTYHGADREAFNRDRRRDLDLKLAGWQIHRFDGDQVRDDTPEVIRIAAKLAAERA